MFGVNASQSKPYETKGASISAFKTSATAYITRCDCLPVDNHLAVWIKVQYLDGDTYYWYPGDGSSYVFDDHKNTTEARKKISHSNICYAEGMQYAKCSGGELKTYYFSVNK